MGLVKREYKDHMTCITAKNLNDIQDAILALAETAQGGAIQHLDALEDIGLAGTVTMAQVLEAMPSYSELVLTSNTNLTNHISDVPGTTGLLIVTKSSVYGVAEWTQVNTNTPAMYRGSWHSTGGWSGWVAEEVTAIDFTYWADGEFTVTKDGEDLSGTVTFDSTNRPTSITLNGHTLTLVLPEVE